MSESSIQTTKSGDFSDPAVWKIQEPELVSISIQLLEGLLGAMASQKYIAEEVPYHREEKQVAIDRVFQEAWQMLAEARKQKSPEGHLRCAWNDCSGVKLCFGFQDIYLKGIRLAEIHREKHIMLRFPDENPNMEEHQVMLFLGESTIDSVLDLFKKCTPPKNLVVSKAVARCCGCGNLKKEFCREA